MSTQPFNHDIIYLDNAATTAVKPAEVLAAQTRETLGPWGNASRSAHAYAMRSMRHMVGAR